MQWDMKKQKYQLAVDTLMIGIKSSKWKTLESVRNLYTAHRLPEPKVTIVSRRSHVLNKEI